MKKPFITRIIKLGLMCLSALGILLAINGCNKEELTKSESKVSAKDISVLEYIKSLGYHDSEIVDLGNDYLVDGDILFSKEKRTTERRKGQGTISQHSTGDSVAQNNISIKVESNLLGHVNEIHAAIALWNHVPDCRINFVMWDGNGSPDITISNDPSIGSTTCGLARFPDNGVAGNEIFMNVGLISQTTNPTQQLISVIAHELGHTVGFRHTNWQARGEPQNAVVDGNFVDAILVPGTPNGDSNSIMNGGTCGIAPSTLSPNDILAFQALYPENLPQPGTPGPVYEFYNSSYNKHSLNMNINVPIAFPGWNSNGQPFDAFLSQVAGTLPVYQFVNSSYDHIYTTDRYPNLSGYSYNGIVFYAYPNQIAGSVPIYEFYNTQAGDHFYSTIQNAHTFFSGWSYGRLAFYAHFE